MTKISHAEPAKHSTRQVDEKLKEVEHKIERAPGAGSPAIKPNEELDNKGLPANDERDKQDA